MKFKIISSVFFSADGLGYLANLACLLLFDFFFLKRGGIFLPCEGALFGRDGVMDSRRSFPLFFLKDLDHFIRDGKAAARILCDKKL